MEQVSRQLDPDRAASDGPASSNGSTPAHVADDSSIGGQDASLTHNDAANGGRQAAGLPHDDPSRVPRRDGPSAGGVAAWVAGRLLQAAGSPRVALELWDGRRLGPESAPYRIRLADRRALWRLVKDPLFEFGELYAQGRLDVSADAGSVRRGNLLGLLLEIDHALNRGGHRRLHGRRPSRWLPSRRNTLSRSRENVHHHYDIGNEFYRLWLDEQLVYTCAYFPRPDMTIEQAQVAKLDHVCRKLQLRPGQRVIEAGCGWGALALHMARHYGVTVRAFNVSREQVAFARQRARDEGLAGRVEFVEDDWRTIDGRCEAFVSVGMLEHVGLQNYPLLGEVIDRCLEPQGRGLIHSIGQNRGEPLNPWIERRIFPGAYPPSLREMLDIFEPRSFSVLDVENLRLHYAETLRHWLERYEAAAEAVRAMFDEPFVRTWRLYLAGSIAAFETGRLQLFQIVFARGDDNSVPWTREHVYEGQGTRDESQGPERGTGGDGATA